MHRSLFPLASLFALIVVAPGCADRSAGPEQQDPRVLYGFDDCDELLSYAKGNAKEMIEEYGNPWGYEEDIALEGGEGGTGDPSGDSGGDGGGAPVDDGNGGGEAAAARTTRAPTCRSSASMSPIW
jgi:hypothetical protein